MIDAISSALNGLQTASKTVARSAEQIANAGGSGVQDTVDISAEAIKIKVAEIAYKANLSTLKTVDEMSEELIKRFDERV